MIIARWSRGSFSVIAPGWRGVISRSVRPVADGVEAASSFRYRRDLGHAAASDPVRGRRCWPGRLVGVGRFLDRAGASALGTAKRVVREDRARLEEHKGLGRMTRIRAAAGRSGRSHSRQVARRASRGAGGDLRPERSRCQRWTSAGLRLKDGLGSHGPGRLVDVGGHDLMQ